jgi:transposase-like protein
MGSPRKRHSKEFKAKVAIEAVKGVKTASELASEYGVHPVQITQWKKQLLEGSASLFETGGRSQKDEQTTLIERLYQQIGQLQVEVEWLRKKGL